MNANARRRRVFFAILLVPCGVAAIAFEPPVPHDVGDFPAGVTVGDVDGDGRGDVVTANANTSDLSLLLNDGSGLAPELRIDYGTAGGRAVAVEDVDGDGDRDLLVMVRSGDSTLVLLRNLGGGLFGAPEAYGPSAFNFALRLTDVDRDGDPDALVVGGFVEEASVTLFLNDGSGEFEVAGSHRLVEVPFVYVADIDVADFDGDGFPDVAGVVDNVDAAVLLLNDRQGGFLPAIPVDLGQRFPIGVLARDVDRDGRPDLVVASCPAGPDELLVGRNEGGGAFSLADTLPYEGGCGGFTNPAGLAAGYLDGDTTVDLLYSSRGSDTLRLLSGAGDGAFAESAQLPAEPEPFVVAVGDVDGDGSHDVIGGSSVFDSADRIVVLANEACAPLFDATILARPDGGFSWPTSLPYLAARGSFESGADFASFTVDLQLQADANLLQDGDLPPADSGFWYLLRPDCDGSSWTSAGANEQPGRDSALP